MTFSIVARCGRTGMFGAAIASSSPAVAARCIHARAAVGVVATQNITDPSLGPRILDALAPGASAQAAIAGALQGSPFAAYRQLLVTGAQGAPAAHCGAHALGLAACAIGADAAAGGNLLAHREVPLAMLEAFESNGAPFAARLLDALGAGLERGGEAGPVHSAGLLVVRELSWPIVDLRVDWSDADPVAALRAIWDIYAPQIEDYVRRAIDPRLAPSFAVPGNP